MIWYQLSNFQRYYRQEIHCVTVVSDLDKEKTISIGSQERRKVNNQGLCFVLTRAVASCRPRVHATGIFFPMRAFFFICFFQSIFLGCVCGIFFIIIFTRLTRPEFAPCFFCYNLIDEPNMFPKSLSFCLTIDFKFCNDTQLI